MRSKLALFLVSCFALYALISCSAQNEVAAAQSSLIAFFEYLAKGDYGKAVDLYGGDYDHLQAMNPLVPADDYETLWKMACTLNGIQCLPVLNVVSAEQISKDEYLFIVNFRDPDGNVFKVDQSCGCGMVGGDPAVDFEYHVLKSGNAFLLQEPPPYIP